MLVLRSITVLALAFIPLSTSLGQSSTPRAIVVTLDGMRWQEIFDGANRALLTPGDGGVADTAFTRRRFWRETVEERRRALFPFLWGTVVEQGQLWGDSSKGSLARVTNRQRFSYPGYNELFTGAADDRIDSNDKIPNRNRTVLEWLASKPSFRGKIDIFGSWDVFPFIFNVGRSKLPVNGEGLPFPSPTTELHRTANEMTEWIPRMWNGARLDAATMEAALDALRTRRPRVLVILLGETDEWAHERRYDMYLDAANRSDRFIERIWKTAQAMPEYRNHTSLLISTDHGRGSGRDWTDHGVEVRAAGRIWMAMMGPTTKRAGVVTNQTHEQREFAGLIAAMLSENWQNAR